MKLKAGNIWSGNNQLAVFTNPTELAFKKGNLRNHYPIKWKNMVFADAEEFYQHLSREIKYDFDACKNACTFVIAEKLLQYPILANTIRESGGANWILRCRHIVGARTANFKRWEGVGLNSAFIFCLHRAYTQYIANN